MKNTPKTKSDSKLEDASLLNEKRLKFILVEESLW